MALGHTDNLAGCCCPDDKFWKIPKRSGLTKGFFLTCSVLVKPIALTWGLVGTVYKGFASYFIPEGGALSALLFTRVLFINL